VLNRIRIWPSQFARQRLIGNWFLRLTPISAPFVRGISTHGTGCTYSAAITALLAQGCELSEAVMHAKEFITQAIAGSVRAGRHPVLNWFWKSRR
jgi:hydroxymethylpyrimidine/phosphomethylpyrimidine kinase